MKSLSMILVLTALITAKAYAGQEGVGGGYCSFANTVCATKGSESADGAILICLFGSDKAHAYVSIEKNGSGERHDFNVDKEPAHNPPLLGAPMRYSGQGLELQINVDTAPRPEGIYSLVSIADLGVRNQTLFCRFQH